MSDFIDEERRGPRTRERSSSTQSCPSSVRACEQDASLFVKEPHGKEIHGKSRFSDLTAARGEALVEPPPSRACTRGSQCSSSSPLLLRNAGTHAVRGGVGASHSGGASHSARHFVACPPFCGGAGGGWVSAGGKKVWACVVTEQVAPGALRKTAPPVFARMPVATGGPRLRGACKDLVELSWLASAPVGRDLVPSPCGHGLSASLSHARARAMPSNEQEACTGRAGQSLTDRCALRC